jgi:hypothetical protein
MEQFGNRVQEGPFAGLILTPMTAAEQLGPYLLGVYESEVEGAWNTVFLGSYTQVIDIGAWFGYFRHHPQSACGDAHHRDARGFRARREHPAS